MRIGSQYSKMMGKEEEHALVECEKGSIWWGRAVARGYQDKLRIGALGMLLGGGGD